MRPPPFARPGQILDEKCRIVRVLGAGGASCDNCSNIVTGGLVRVVRGGAWLLNAYNPRSAMRDYDTMTSRLAYGGFRCARGQ